MSKTYKYMRIRLASSDEILSWSHGEVKKHETINYRTLKPEPDGLFCERIFGPTKDYQCQCGKSKRNVDKGKVCEKCGVEITEAKVRRERFGHIKLAAPVVHTWFLKNSPSRIATLLDIKAKDLEEVVYLASYIVTDPGNVPGLTKKQILSETEYSELFEQYGKRFEALTGAEAVKKLLHELNLQREVEILRKKLKTSSKQRRDRAIKRLEVVESFLNSDNNPEWMVLDVLPVIPPDLRPMVQLDGGRFATTDLNDLYRRILNRNNRLKRQYEQNAPHLITKNEKRMLQEAVDSLIDNAKRGRRAAVEKNHSLKSLSDMLRGKQGRFRQNLLGKRVDYSGRSVIVVGPDLKMYQCGLPKEMALTLFKPFVIRELTKPVEGKENYTIGAAKKMCDQQNDLVWGVLEEVIKEHPVLLNRAPTLHRLGIQAFEPKLIEGKAIRLHPLVCTAFNADFDGDQMAVHVPLSQEAQAEARLLMIACNNILNPKDGKPVVTPSQDMILGNYYLSLERAYHQEDGKLREEERNEGRFFIDFNEAYMAYKNNEISLHTRIFIDPKSLPSRHFDGIDLNGKYLLTTVGKLIFNKILPDEFPYVNDGNADLESSTPEEYFLNMRDKDNSVEKMLQRKETTPFKKKFLAKIIAEVFKRFQITETSKMLDNLKNLGFQYSTISGITISIADIEVYKEKAEEIKKAEDTISQYQDFFEEGLLTEKERYEKVCAVWAKTRDEIEDGLWSEMKQKKDNAIFMMADSGSRGSSSNFAQLAGMRGMMADTNGRAIEVPVKANFYEGLTVSEFFISSHGSRKGSTDTALKTAESGYLTRRLVDVAQDVTITQEDCGTDKGFDLRAIVQDDGKLIESLGERAVGRYPAKDVINPKTGEIIVHRNELITESIGEAIDAAQIDLISIRSNLTCGAKNGVCMKCYGRNLATNKIVEVGEAVGVIAAQSIGEPGTQLTMRTFHNGGVASGGDITQGLPRVQELFEARKPKGKATISEISGKVTSITRAPKGGYMVEIKNDVETKAYNIDATAELLIQEGQEINRGQKLMKGSIAPKELLRVTDAETVQHYLVDEVQKVYRSQGVEISDKHIEIIVKQMLRKLEIVTEGTSKLLPGLQISANEFKAEVMSMIKNKQPGEEISLPVAKPLLLGITKAALGSESFLSASSFQETTRVLTDAAIKGKKDELFGLKENIIIGGLIPAGTGILQEESFECEHKPHLESDDEIEEENQIVRDEDDFDEELDAEDLLDSDDEVASTISEAEFNEELA